MLRLGITGGIGSGKTTVCQIFKALDIPVYNADERAKYLVNNYPEIKKEIIDNFGEKSFENNFYNRTFIADIVFKDKSKLETLNNIIHPKVFEDWNEFCQLNKNKKYIIKEAAIMLETDSKNTVDKICLVYSPLELRILRLLKRDNSTQEQILQRINQQMSDEEKIPLADYIIYNDENLSLIEQVLELNKKINYLII